MFQKHLSFLKLRNMMKHSKQFDLQLYLKIED